MISDNHRKLETFFTFILLLFGEFKCCLLPYGSRYTSPLSSTARELDKNRIYKNRPESSLEVKAVSHLFLICIGLAEIKHVFGLCFWLLQS